MKTSHHVYQTPLALRSLNVTLNSHFFLLKIQFPKVLIPWMGSCLDWLLGLLEFRVFCKLTGLFRIEELSLDLLFHIHRSVCYDFLDPSL